MTRNSRLNSLSGTKNKSLLFKVVKTNWTHNNRPFLDTRCCHIAGVIDKKVSVTNIAGPWGGAQAEEVHFFVDQRFGRLELGKPLKDHNDQFC